MYECSYCHKHFEAITADVKRRTQERCKPCSRIKYKDPKECRIKAVQKYTKTKKGVISGIYRNQTRSSKQRNMDLPDYTNEQLQLWCLEQPIFHKLFKKWEKSNYYKDLKPSVDRLDDYKPYTFDNVQLMTWLENKTKNEEQVKNGDKPHLVKPVVQLTKDDECIAEFYSISEAQRQTGINVSNIHNVCNGKYGFKTAGGFKWKFKN